MNLLLLGAFATLGFTVGLLFLRSWRRRRARLSCCSRSHSGLRG